MFAYKISCKIQPKVKSNYNIQGKENTTQTLNSLRLNPDFLIHKTIIISKFYVVNISCRKLTLVMPVNLVDPPVTGLSH